MKKRKMLLLSFLLCLSVVNIRAEEKKALVIEMTNGNQTTFVLSEKPEITFANHVIQININSQDTNFELSNVRQFYFSNVLTDISTFKASELKITYLSDDNVIIDGIEKDDKISIVSVGGILYKNRVKLNGHQAAVSLNALPRGTYIISILNKQTFKIYKK